ncbi:hypothetical protein KR100_14210 [Synechococcus sp. KORDI-100]|uniref:hypothetical protein n=1 Tax=Synechococcus sp. KORDI-100 TaxID=1280380 RepID=UPI0004E06A09|nr:hypothetical protein [Synechococcus sp. KORDI-100]AII44502.1 hypothetical protein KR100_14210 [Synechococcus sp. KORDI-100]
MDPTPSPSTPEVNQGKPFSGARVLVAVAIGSAIGAAIAFFLTVLIKNSPAEIPDQRTRLFVIMVITSGGLAGFSIESMRQLQEETTDEAYRRYNRHRGMRR